MTQTVYVLFDERYPDVPRYVGISDDPDERLKNHLYGALHLRLKSHKDSWLRKAVREGARPQWRALVLVETKDEAARIEIAMIARYRARGYPITNQTLGGEGAPGYGGVLTPEALARRTATINSPAYLAKRSRLSSAYWLSAEAREQQRQAMEEWWASPESATARASMLAAAARRIGQKRTAETCAKIRAARLGKLHPRQRTPEWNAKISAAQKGKPRPQSDETKAKRAAAMKRPETRAKMSASAKARWARPAEPKLLFDTDDHNGSAA